MERDSGDSLVTAAWSAVLIGVVVTPILILSGALSWRSALPTYGLLVLLAFGVTHWKLGSSRRWPPSGRVAALLVVLTFAWFVAVPLVRDAIRGSRPGTVSDLARICEGKRAFRGTAPYRGAGPHPVVVFLEGLDSYPVGEKSRPEIIQLVGCATSDDREAPEKSHSCEYTGGRADYLLGHYRLDVREARTGRLVDSFTVDGDTPGDCPTVEWFRTGSNSVVHLTEPAARDYAALLDPLVNDPARL